MSHKLSQRAIPLTQRRPWGGGPKRCAMWPPMTSATNRIAASVRKKDRQLPDLAIGQISGHSQPVRPPTAQ